MYHFNFPTYIRFRIKTYRSNGEININYVTAFCSSSDKVTKTIKEIRDEADARFKVEIEPREMEKEIEYA